MGLITGFIEGTVTYDLDGTIQLLPFQDTIEEASFSYEGEILYSETFSNRGIKGASAACFHKEAAMFELSTSNINWAFLQASTAQRDEARVAPVPVTETLVLDTGTVDLEFAPATGTAVIVANSEGTQFTSSVTGQTVTVTGGTDGERVTVSYSRDAGADERSIELGKNEKIRENAIYGRFFGCPDELLIVANRTVITPKLDLGVGDDAATAGMELKCLRDDNGVFASIIRIEP